MNKYRKHYEAAFKFEGARMVVDQGLSITQDHRLGDELHNASGFSLSGVADGYWTAANNGWTDITFRSW